MLPSNSRSLPRMQDDDNFRARNDHGEQVPTTYGNSRPTESLRAQNQQQQQPPPYNRTSRVAAWNEQRRQASADQARMAAASAINASPSGPPPTFSPRPPRCAERAQFGLPHSRTEPGFDNSKLQVPYPTRNAPLRSPALRSAPYFENQRGLQMYYGEYAITESDVQSQRGELDRNSLAFTDNFSPIGEEHPQLEEDQPLDEDQFPVEEPLSRDHSGFPTTRGMLVPRRVRASRLRFSDNFSQINVPFQGSGNEEDELEQPHIDEDDLEAPAEARPHIDQEDIQEIRDFQERFRARHDQPYSRGLHAECQPPIGHEQGVEAQNQLCIAQRPAVHQPTRTQHHHAGYQAVRQPPHLPPYSRGLPPQIQPPPQRSNAGHQRNRALQAKNAPHIHHQTPPAQAGMQANYGPQYNHTYQNPHQRHYQHRSEPELSVEEFLVMDRRSDNINSATDMMARQPTSSADGFNGNPLVTIIPPPPETHSTGTRSRLSDSLHPMMVGLGAHPSVLEGDAGEKKKKKKLAEIKKKVTKAKNWLSSQARETYEGRML